MWSRHTEKMTFWKAEGGFRKLKNAVHSRAGVLKLRKSFLPLIWSWSVWIKIGCLTGQQLPLTCPNQALNLWRWSYQEGDCWWETKANTAFDLCCQFLVSNQEGEDETSHASHLGSWPPLLPGHSCSPYLSACQGVFLIPSLFSLIIYFPQANSNFSHISSVSPPKLISSPVFFFLVH